MKKFTLTKTAKGQNFVYTVTDEAGNVLSTRTSKRDYVACTTNGSYYFGRLDLVGKGDHGRSISWNMSRLASPEKSYKESSSWMDEKTKQEYFERCPIEKFIQENRDALETLNSIAYLTK